LGRPDPFYVSISRARYDAQVFTDDLKTLERAVGKDQKKSVAMEVVKPAPPTTELRPAQALNTTELKPQQPGASDIGHEETTHLAAPVTPRHGKNRDPGMQTCGALSCTPAAHQLFPLSFQSA
jgi:hypothetical protein